MPRTIFSLASRSFSTDRDTGQLSIFEVLEGISALAFPVVLPEVAFTTLLEKATGEPDSRRMSFVVAIGGQELARMSFDVNFAHGNRFRMSIRVNGLVVPSAGPLSFFVDGQQDVYVIPVEGPSPDATSPGFRPLIPGM